MKLQGTRMDSGWTPSESDRAYGLRMNLTDRQIDGYAEDMKLWAMANAHRAVARKLDWHLAFKGWMRRRMNNHGNTDARTQKRERSAHVERMLADAIEKASHGNDAETVRPLPGRQ